MVGKAKPANKAEKSRMERLAAMPCMACVIELELCRKARKLGEPIPLIRHCGLTEVHHLLSGNKRRGHAFTVPLGSWHHRAALVGAYAHLVTRSEMAEFCGPSLAMNSKAFRARYGTDDQLLARTNELIHGPNGRDEHGT